ncbi:MAG: YitT family protein [Oscillospiraceae bacterium]|jgi:uncharacterized membrane-anchored protein YitT (DUF2179 family)|nr:YitT family protein [Oscillospiraceae bacterium]
MVRLDDKKKEFAIDVVAFFFGNMMLAITTNIFVVPNNLAPGGLVGAATMLQTIFGFPVGWTTLAMNVPLFILAHKKIGHSFLIKSLFSTVMYNVLIEVTKPFIVQFGFEYKGDILLTSVFAGLLGGASSSLIFMRGGTSGGIDIIASLLSIYNSHISIGKLLLILDVIVIAISAFVYDVEKAFYATVCVFVTTKVIDAVMYGVDVGTGKIVFIISPKNEEISQKITEELLRGSTKLKSKGSYTGKEGEILLCAIRRHEVFQLRSIVNSIDENAFMIVTDAREITGEGFKKTPVSIQKTTISDNNTASNSNQETMI